MRICRLGWLFATVSFFTLGNSIAVGHPNVIEAYGDSLTAGFLSGTSLTAPPPNRGVTADDLSISKLLHDMLLYRITGDTSLLVPEHWPQLAWPQVLSELEQTSSHAISVHNEAISGAEIKDLMGQVQGAPVNRRKTQAFFYIGHNDLCNTSMTPDEQAQSYYEQYAAALQYWDQNHQNSEAILVPLLDLSRVFTLLDGYVWYKGPEATYDCDFSWTRLFPYCPSYLPMYKKGELPGYVQPRVEAMNQELHTLAEQMEEKSTGSNHFSVLDHVYDQQFSPDYFAVDCYHLSAVGQQTIATTFKTLLDAQGGHL